MALVSAQLTVNFTAFYSGPHRICWRTGGAGPYDCSTVVVCAGGGGPCSGIISLTVDEETCVDLVIDGYVQASCQDILSLVDRIPFSYTFTPSPTCKKWTVTCDSVPVLDAVITLAGSGYIPLPTPAPLVSISGGGGSGATAVAIVGDGAITMSSIFAGGAGYAPDATYIGVPLTGGLGTGATADITVTGGVVVTVLIVNAGVGYQFGDSLSALDANLGGGGGAGFLLQVDASDYGTIIDVNITAGGSGYVTVPGLSIAPPPAGVTATATAVLGYCSTFASPSCTTPSGINIPGDVLQPTDTISVCSLLVPTVPVEYSVVENGTCLCDCEYVTLTATGAGIVDYWANLCDGSQQFGTLSPTAITPASISACVVIGSLIYKITSGTPSIGIVTGVCP